MEKISNGFELCPYAQSVGADEQLVRYIPTNRFLQLLESKSMWFTRVINWRKGDPCEAILLPVFRNSLMSTHRGALAIKWMVADLELGLKTHFGCCFMLYDGHEKDHMWRIYCPEPESYGVYVIIKASAVNAMLIGSQCRPFKFRRIRYITEEEASQMQVKDTDHSHHPHNPAYFDASESLFVKRKAYEAENEVRAIITNGTFRNSYLIWFADRFNIPLKAFDEEYMGSRVPEGTLRLGLPGVGGESAILELNEAQTALLIDKIDREYDVTFGQVLGEKGINIPFELSEIEAIVYHPFLESEVEKFTQLLGLLKKNKIENRLVPSKLYNTKWY